MKIRQILEQIDEKKFEEIKKTIEDFDKGTVSRNKFLEYLKGQLELLKRDDNTQDKQIELLQKQIKQNKINQKSGVGTNVEVGQ